MTPDTALQALVVDYGGVLTSGVKPALARWFAADGIDPEAYRAVMREWLAPESVRNPIHDLETGAMTGPDFETALAQELSARSGRPVHPTGLLTRMFDDFDDEPTMYDAVRRARAGGLRTALLSNSWANDYPRDGWDELFDVTVISGEVGLRKPDPAIYALTAERLGLPVTACVFVDDLRANVQAAARAGMIGVLHRDAATTIGELAVLFGWD